MWAIPEQGAPNLDLGVSGDKNPTKVIHVADDRGQTPLFMIADPCWPNILAFIKQIPKSLEVFLSDDRVILSHRDRNGDTVLDCWQRLIRTFGHDDADINSFDAEVTQILRTHQNKRINKACEMVMAFR